MCRTWREAVKASEKKLFPVAPNARDAVDKKAKQMRAGLKAACERLPRKPRREDTMRVVRPRARPPAPAAVPPEHHDEEVDRDTIDAESEHELGNTSEDLLSSDGGDDGDGHEGPGDGDPPGRGEPAVVAPAHTVYIGPWPNWQIGEFGALVLDASKGSLGAHCSRHGGSTCRANKVIKRKPLGFLVAWLMAGHSDPHCNTCGLHADKKDRIRSDVSYADRVRARNWLLERRAAFEDLLDLEKQFHAPGSFEEHEQSLHFTACLGVRRVRVRTW